jgi:hypothetical protein
MPTKARTKRRAKPPPRPVAKNGAAPRALHYKVVELSNVDEGALERAINEWVSRGWTFDGVQFAMRESSKRPSMAFVFFTRDGPPLDEPAAEPERYRDQSSAEAHFARLVDDGPVAPMPDPWQRLAAMAHDEEGD